MKKTQPSSKKLPSGHSTPSLPKKPSADSKRTIDEEAKDTNWDPAAEESMVVSNGESVLVAVRVRPMNSNESQRGDETCLKVFNERELQIYEKGQQKLYQFNAVLPESTGQDSVFLKCAISVNFWKMPFFNFFFYI